MARKMTERAYNKAIHQPYVYLRGERPWARLWYKSVPFNEAEYKAFLKKCKAEKVKYPARKLRELAMEWAGYHGKKD